MSGTPRVGVDERVVRDGDGELAYHQVRFNQPPLNFSTDGSTIDDLISCDTRSSHGSVFSYRSDRDINNFIREVNGRRFNNHNITYFLPSGTSSVECTAQLSSAQLTRFRSDRRHRIQQTVRVRDYTSHIRSPDPASSDKQHLMAMLAVGDIYPCPELISEILKPEPGVQKSILDLGMPRFQPYFPLFTFS